MYNRYIPSGASYTRIPVGEPEDARRSPSPDRGPERPEHGHRGSAGPAGGSPGSFSIPGFLTGEGGGLTRLLGALKLEELDTGDILLLLIVLLLLLEGDNLELVIALGLVLILGLGDDKEEEEK